MTGVLTNGMAVMWCESSGSEPDRARERPSSWLPTRGTVLLGDGEDPAQHGSTGKGSWATQAGDLGVKATFDQSSQWSRRLRSAVRVRHPVWLVRTNDQRTRRISRRRKNKVRPDADSRDWPEARDGASGLSKDLRAASCRDVNKAARLEPALPKQPQAATREQSSTYTALGRRGSRRYETGPGPRRLPPKRHRVLPKRLLP